MRFSPTLENSRDDSRHISRRERTLGVGVGSTINVSPDPFPSRARASGETRKENLLTLNNKSGRELCSAWRTFGISDSARYKPDAKARTMHRTRILDQ